MKPRNDCKRKEWVWTQWTSNLQEKNPEQVFLKLTETSLKLAQHSKKKMKWKHLNFSNIWAIYSFSAFMLPFPLPNLNVCWTNGEYGAYVWTYREYVWTNRENVKRVEHTMGVWPDWQTLSFTKICKKSNVQMLRRWKQAVRCLKLGARHTALQVEGIWVRWVEICCHILLGSQS